jgi:hypothetical protein
MARETRPGVATNLISARLTVPAVAVLVVSLQVNLRSVINDFAAAKIACQQFV